MPTSAPGSLRDLLAGCLGVQAVVTKRRLLCRFSQARIHCDEVEGLGAFLEVEVVLLPGQPAEEGQRLARWLQHQLEVQDDDLIGCAYADLPSANVSELVPPLQAVEQQHRPDPPGGLVTDR